MRLHGNVRAQQLGQRLRGQMAFDEEDAALADGQKRVGDLLEEAQSLSLPASSVARPPIRRRSSSKPFITAFASPLPAVRTVQRT